MLTFGVISIYLIYLVVGGVSCYKQIRSIADNAKKKELKQARKAQLKRFQNIKPYSWKS